MNNIICLVIDSLGYEQLKKYPFQKDLFLSQLEERSFHMTDLSAQSPFTEAAVMGLQCGQKTMDYGGYLTRLEDTPLTIFEAFQKHGYRVFNNVIQPHMFAKSLCRGITDPFFDVCPDFAALQSYRLYYYKDKYLKHQLSESEVQFVNNLFLDYLTTAISFDESILGGENITSLIAKNFNQKEISSNLFVLQKELKLFSKNPTEYVQRYYSTPLKNTVLFQNRIPDAGIKIANDSTRRAIFRLIHPIYKQERRLFFKLNKKNNKPDTRNLLHIIKNALARPNFKSLGLVAKAFYYNHSGYHMRNYRSLDTINFDKAKSAPSMNTHLHHFLNWRKNQTNPYFAYIHVDDVHGISSFFTYDTQDLNLVQSQTEKAKSLMKRMPSTQKGNINFLLGIQYVDDEIRRFYNTLKSEGDLKNTILVITADHGYSFMNDPVRSQPINTFHKECYRIPFIVVNETENQVEPYASSGYQYSYSIPNTLLSLAGLPENQLFAGKSLFQERPKEIFIQEFMGGGCPDYRNRPILLCARNRCFAISAKKKLLDGELSFDDIYELFDLTADSGETNNLNMKKQQFRNQVEPLYKALFERVHELRKEYNLI